MAGRSHRRAARHGRWPLAAALLALAPAALPEAGTRDLAGGVHSEYCVALAPGKRLDYRFEASGPVQFNAHYHAGREVLYPVPEREALDGAGQVRVDAPQDLCLMWSNSARTPVHLQFEAGVVPDDEPGQPPRERH